MKKLSILRQPKWFMGLMIVLLLVGLGYIHISNQRASMMVKLVDSQQKQLLDYKRQGMVRHSEFKIQHASRITVQGVFIVLRKHVWGLKKAPEGA